MDANKPSPEESKRAAIRRRFHALEAWIASVALASSLSKRLTDGQVSGLLLEFKAAATRGGPLR